MNTFRRRWVAWFSWQRLMPLGLSMSLPAVVRGGNHVGYRYEYYQEENNRMEINTHAVDFEQKIIDSVTTKGELVYDGISGATPTGTHDGAGNVITTHMEDLRRAANLELDGRLGRQTLTPGFAWSKEHDYLSYGISMGDAIDFNDKNTTSNLASPTSLIVCGIFQTWRPGRAKTPRKALSVFPRFSPSRIF